MQFEITNAMLELNGQVNYLGLCTVTIGEPMDTFKPNETKPDEKKNELPEAVLAELTDFNSSGKIQEKTALAFYRRADHGTNVTIKGVTTYVAD